MGRWFFVFQNTTEILEDGMVSGDQWNHIVLRSFFVLEERLSALSCMPAHQLHFARIISFVGEVVFEDISLFLEAGRRRAHTEDAGDQTFRHTFQSMEWMAAR
jgi:hypothetical protein